MPEILLLVAAIGAVLVNVITAWGNRARLDQVVQTSKVIEGHVNSAATRSIVERESLITEKTALRDTIEEMKKTAALLAQSAAITGTVVKKPEG